MLKTKSFIKVGIIGDRSGRQSRLTNAQVGMFHEFGTTNIPKRSFLYEPITENLDKELAKQNILNKETLSKTVKTGSKTEVLKKIAIVAESIVAQAFATGGYGKWTPWKNPHYQNNTGMLLVDSQQLRNSISSEVVEK